MGHECLKCEEKVQRIRVSLSRRSDRPFVAVALSVYVQVRTRDLYTVGVAMRPTIEIKPHEDDRLPSSVLIGSFR